MNTHAFEPMNNKTLTNLIITNIETRNKANVKKQTND